MSNSQLLPIGAPEELVSAESVDELVQLVPQLGRSDVLHIKLRLRGQVANELERLRGLFMSQRVYLALCVQNSGMSDRDCGELCGLFFQKNYVIYSLDISFNGALQDRHLAPMIRTRSFLGLLSLDVSFTQIGSGFWKLFAQTVKQENCALCLTRLRLAGTPLCSDGARGLGTIIRSAAHLTHFSVACTQLSVQGALEVANALGEAGRAQELEFACLKTADEKLSYGDGILALQNFIKAAVQIQPLKSLDLSGIQLQDRGFEALVHSIHPGRSGLQFVCVSQCGLTDSSLDSVDSLLKLQAQSIRRVSLQGNRFTEQGLAKFFDTFQGSTILDFRRNQLQTAVAAQLQRQNPSCLFVPVAGLVGQSNNAFMHRESFLSIADLERMTGKANDLVPNVISLDQKRQPVDATTKQPDKASGAGEKPQSTAVAYIDASPVPKSITLLQTKPLTESRAAVESEIKRSQYFYDTRRELRPTSAELLEDWKFDEDPALELRQPSEGHPSPILELSADEDEELSFTGSVVPEQQPIEVRPHVPVNAKKQEPQKVVQASPAVPSLQSKSVASLPELDVPAPADLTRFQGSFGQLNQASLPGEPATSQKSLQPSQRTHSIGPFENPQPSLQNPTANQPVQKATSNATQMAAAPTSPSPVRSTSALAEKMKAITQSKVVFDPQAKKKLQEKAEKILGRERGMPNMLRPKTSFFGDIGAIPQITVENTRRALQTLQEIGLKNLDVLAKRAEQESLLFTCQSYTDPDLTDPLNSELIFTRQSVLVINEYSYNFDRLLVQFEMILEQEAQIIFKIFIDDAWVVIRMLPNEWERFKKVGTIWEQSALLDAQAAERLQWTQNPLLQLLKNQK